MKTRQPRFSITWEGKDISSELQPYVQRIRYTDKAEKKADSIEIQLANPDGRWLDNWFPLKGDKLSVDLGYEGESALPCGTFSLDDISFSGFPDRVTIRGLAASITQDTRTEKSRAFENLTLREIAQQIADAQGLTLQGEVADILIKRSTQNRETDLGYLKRVSQKFGYLFSVRDSLLIFTNVFDLQDQPASITVLRKLVNRYSFRSSTAGAAEGSSSKFFSGALGEEISAIAEADESTGNPEGVADTKEIRERAETQEQADRMARASLREANINSMEATIDSVGRVLLVAGNSVNLHGFGKLSGKFFIDESTHTYDRSSGYTTSFRAVRTKKTEETIDQSF